MQKRKDLDDILQDHERRLLILEGKKSTGNKSAPASWYRPGSTTGKIVVLIDVGFFDQPRSLADILAELKTRDYHFADSDVTLPLRRIVRKRLLRKTKKHADGTPSKTWLYVRTR